MTVPNMTGPKYPVLEDSQSQSVTQHQTATSIAIVRRTSASPITPAVRSSARYFWRVREFLVTPSRTVASAQAPERFVRLISPIQPLPILGFHC